MASKRSDLRRTIGGYAELLRVPNLFTAPPDVFLGAALIAATNGTNGTVSGSTVVAVTGAALASMLLYAGGTALNDYFDAAVDAVERPERPIPSGRVPHAAALTVGLALLTSGVIVAFVAAGVVPAVVAAMLSVAILLYDGALKESAAGFLVMGVTRGLDVALGVTAMVAAGSELSTTSASVSVFTFEIVPATVTIVGVPVVITSYIAAVTYMAAEEAVGIDRRAVAVGGAGTVFAALSVPVIYALVGIGPSRLALGLALTIGFLAWTGRALRRAYVDPVPETVGPAVGTCVLALVVLNAAFAAVGGVVQAGLVFAFFLPAVGLARVFNVS
jgi:4-hydroxybenzoate polyprenyltransferase